ncbi:MAG: hypothetical protein JNM27_12950 [Leptospirales bacterium]|nr:hypothetical protein [Leptospirales bacterium]
MAPPVKSNQPIRDRLDVYELAFHLYFREEKKENAIDVLAWACQNVNDEREVSCYDLGHILSREGKLEEAFRAFEHSYKIKPNGNALAGMMDMYAAGVGSMPAAPSHVTIVKEMERQCRASNPDAAFAVLQKYLEAKPPLPGRNLFAQPFFAECLKAVPGYAALLTSLPLATTPGDQIYRMRAANHPLGKVMDVVPYLRSEGLAFESVHPVNYAWKNFVNAARRGDVITAERQYEMFGQALDKTRTPDGAQNAAILAMKRAAGTLVAGDPFFYSVRNSPRIQKMIRDALPGSGLFEKR